MIILIRHGETALNASRIVQPPDTPLNVQGERQAQRLATRLTELGVEHVLSSDLLRARMTAEAIVRATQASIEYVSLLQERNFGAIRGKSYAEVGQEKIFAPDYVPEGGESWPAFDQRVTRAWALVVQVANRMRGNLAVVTHGLVCRSIAEQFLGLPEGQSAPTRWGNTSLSLCEAAPPHRASLVNCVAHLEDGGDDRTAPSGI